MLCAGSKGPVGKAPAEALLVIVGLWSLGWGTGGLSLSWADSFEFHHRGILCGSPLSNAVSFSSRLSTVVGEGFWVLPLQLLLPLQFSELAATLVLVLVLALVLALVPEPVFVFLSVPVFVPVRISSQSVHFTSLLLVEAFADRFALSMSAIDTGTVFGSSGPSIEKTLLLALLLLSSSKLT